MYSLSVQDFQFKRIIARAVLMLVVILAASSAFTVSSYAKDKGNKTETAKKEGGGGGSLENDKVVTGGKKLLKDAITVFQALGGTICGLAAIYFFIRKAYADEQDQKIWRNRLAISLISAVGIVTVGGIFQTILSYFQ
jgi:hypothetical protein